MKNQVAQDELDMFNFSSTRELADLKRKIELAEMRQKLALIELIAFSCLVFVTVGLVIKCLL